MRSPNKRPEYLTYDCVYIRCSHVLLDAEAGALHMLSKSQTWTLDAGQTVHLECEFIADQFNLFDNPIVWRKRQHRPVTWSPSVTSPSILGTTSSPSEDVHDHYGDLPAVSDDEFPRDFAAVTVTASSVTSSNAEDSNEEETQINMMGNLVEPFASARRFKATFNSQQQAKSPSFLFGLTISSKCRFLLH
jgi:hypothetical protein